MYDTVKGSDYLGDQDAIEFICPKACDTVVELEHYSMPFDRQDNGKIYQRPFGGHTSNYNEYAVKRACAAADRTGHAMLHTPYQRNVRARTQFFVEWMALDLIRIQQGDLLGVAAMEMESGEVMILQAKATLLATGGVGRIYATSTNAFINTGDGMGMAARASIPLEDMEFWQFHPTGVAGAGVLITEGVPGKGGGLLSSDAMNINGKNGLVCITKLADLREPVVIRPLPGLPVIRDLIVDMLQFFKQHHSIKPYVANDTPPPEKERLQSPQDREELNGLYECILCACCSTSCPSFWWNPDKFVGPAGLLQAYRFIADTRDQAVNEHLDNLEDPYRLFSCHSIMNCVDVCPKVLNPTRAIGKIKDLLVKRTV